LLVSNAGVTVNSLHPGMIDTGIWRNVPFPLNLPLKIIIKGYFKVSFAITVTGSTIYAHTYLYYIPLFLT
jgi:NAD(P)-dependent dehydrogenase (short-subunit alcohol dehydrogenase family)